MLKSVQAFLGQIIDYAGMFPPAQLTLEEALGNYLQYRRASPHAWMLGRFVCPTTCLADAAKCVASSEDADPLRVSALGQRAADAAGFLAQLDKDLEIIQDLRQQPGCKLAIEMLELAMPLTATPDQVAALLTAMNARLCQANLHGFLEIPWPLITGLPDAIAFERPPATNGRKKTDLGIQVKVGLKVRCGGTTAEAFPTAAQIASFIIHCIKIHVPWKATAGLHHPYGFWDESLKVWQHGFLNLFGAAMLANSHRRVNPLSATDIEAILADHEGRHFRFDEAGFAWQDWSCRLSHIREIREYLALSFGSCSFVEPCEELYALGLIGV